MSGDLISKTKLMEDIRNTITENSSTLDWLNLIDRQPTAYNVDKVVEQLKGYTWWTEAKYDEDGFCCEESEEVICLEDAIKIVKVGGVE